MLHFLDVYMYIFVTSHFVPQMRAFLTHVYDPHFRCYNLSCNIKEGKTFHISWLMGWFKAKRDRRRRMRHLLTRCTGVTGWICDLFCCYWKPLDSCLCTRFSDPPLGMLHFSPLVYWMSWNGTHPYLIQAFLRYVAFSWCLYVYICNFAFCAADASFF